MGGAWAIKVDGRSCYSVGVESIVPDVGENNGHTWIINGTELLQDLKLIALQEEYNEYKKSVAKNIVLNVSNKQRGGKS